MTCAPCRSSVLSSAEWDVFMLDPPYDVANVVASTFARYPYPESFFAAHGALTPAQVKFFTRANRPPPGGQSPKKARAAFPCAVQIDRQSHSDPRAHLARRDHRPAVLRIRAAARRRAVSDRDAAPVCGPDARAARRRVRVHGQSGLGAAALLPGAGRPGRAHGREEQRSGAGGARRERRADQRLAAEGRRADEPPIVPVDVLRSAARGREPARRASPASPGPSRWPAPAIPRSSRRSAAPIARSSWPALPPRPSRSGC